MPPARRVPWLWPAVTRDAGHIASGVRSPRQARMVFLPGPRLPARMRRFPLAGRPARLLIDFLPLRQGLLARQAHLDSRQGQLVIPARTMTTNRAMRRRAAKRRLRRTAADLDIRGFPGYPWEISR